MNSFVNAKNSHHQMAPKISESIVIPVRHLDFHFSESEIQEFWFANNALLTCFMAALSSAFPEGERQFIYSIRNYQPQIQDHVLLKQVRAFIGQEAHHGKEHELLNELMQQRGYPVERIYRRFIKMNKMMQTQFSFAHQLASTVCMEHLTAILSDYFISTRTKDLQLFDPQLRTIWAWHAIEETEHKAVAFDVYQRFVKRPLFLRLVMLETTFFFVLITAKGTWEFLKSSKRQFNIKANLQGLHYLFGMQGMLAKISKPYLSFFKPNFHPWLHDNRNATERLKLQYLVS